MASSTSALSYLDPGAYQNVAPSSGSIAAAATTGSAPSTGVSATDEIKAMESQGDFQAYLGSSMALALLQPASSTDSTTTNSAALIDNMLQQVLGAYQTQATPAGAGTAASSIGALG